MKKTVLVLAVLILAAPAWATVYITATDEGGGVVRIDYNSVGEPNRVRAFALDITITDGNIVDINDYFVGECDDVNRGHGIFPGTIDINSTTGDVNDWGSPVAPANAPGAYGGIGTGGITIEMGSLFVDPNYPSDTGILCRVTVIADCNLSVTTNIVRGGVVLENPAVSPTVDLSGATDVSVYTGCFPQSHGDWAVWDSVGRPDCWCPEDAVPGIPGSEYQCKGDADGDYDGKDKYGSRQYVVLPDLQILAGGWQRYDDDPNFSTFICADFDHDYDGKDKYGSRQYVVLPDLQILAVSWQLYDDDPCMVDYPCFP